MSDELVTSDIGIIDLLRKHGSMTVSEMAVSLDVTATAVRQRLSRLMGQGHIERTATRAGRGRPSHHYRLTTKGRRKAGSNFGDLAVALWEEIVAIQDPSVRRALIQRVSGRLAENYEGQVEGTSVEQRMKQVAKVFRDRRVSFSVESNGEKPRLTALSCPYPDLANDDRSICAMERQLLTKLLGNSAAGAGVPYGRRFMLFVRAGAHGANGTNKRGGCWGLTWCVSASGGCLLPPAGFPLLVKIRTSCDGVGLAVGH